MNRKIFSVFAFLLLTTVNELAFAGTCQDIMIPLYVYPDTWNPQGAWNRAMNADLPEGRVRYLIINPNSGPGNGPGTQQYTDYSQAISQVRASGNEDMLICGYVRTNYANQPAQTIEDEISRYNDWYNVDCIFLDEVSTQAEQIPFYQSRINFYNNLTKGSDIILNHGYWPDQGYMNISTPRRAELIHVVTENSYTEYTTNPALVNVPQWVLDWPENTNWRMVHLIHSVPNLAAVHNALQISSERNAGGIFITDDILNNPWDWSNGEPFWETLASETTLDCE